MAISSATTETVLTLSYVVMGNATAPIVLMSTAAPLPQQQRKLLLPLKVTTGIMRAGSLHDRISGDVACCADWVLLTEDNRLTTVESSIFRT